MNKLIPVILTFLILSSCTSLRILDTETSEKVKEKSLCYYLPKNTVNIEFVIEKTNFKKGPYSRYTNKYFDISKFIEEDDVKYRIKDIKLSQSASADSSQAFYIKKGRNIIENINLSPSSILLSVNKEDDYCTKTKQYTYIKKEVPEINFYDMSISGNTAETIDTIYKTIQIDTITKTMPVYKRRRYEKDTDMKAKEIAEAIFRIRKKRIELLTGIDEDLPERNINESHIEELKRLEENYLKLFIGNKQKITYTVHYEFTPTKTNTDKTFFRFSTSKGINNITGYPVSLKVEKENYTISIDSLYGRQEKFCVNNGLNYRIPELCNVKVYLGEKMLARKKIWIAQLGFINAIPYKYLRKGIKLDFYNNYGNLKSTEK